ncbi:porin family protein [Halpernia frigidisoli]|uniref:Outer membrane insertion C-terminal signal n=1 Tax=Halpernia frigidisoli TaxID=1125876 RepID=A0A1I3CSJ2_9FLAO|nr:porin family protein [Halpernia frigidisoli]SFH77221.1 outer membrane insertion C-terminal signal [Halpernia frigidisoli]
MKKLILSTALFSAVFLSAQIDLRSTRFGITAGPNYSRVQNAHNPSGPRYSFYAGVLALIPIDNNSQFYLQPELLYLGAGETGKDKDAKNKPGYNAKYSSNYISVPINFKAYFSEAESEFFAFAGPRFDFLVSQTVTDTNRPESYSIENFGKAATFNFNIGAGVGYSFKRQLELSLKYDAGLSNAYPDLKNSPSEIKTNDPDVAKKKSQQTISVGLSYIFQ